MNFPTLRLRRLRRNRAVRSLVQETHLRPSQLIQPLFIRPGGNTRTPISTMPGQEQLSPDNALKEAETLHASGIQWIILFGIPEHKDPAGSDAYHPEGIVQQAVRRLKKELPDLGIIGDVCLCEFTDHGHCGVLKDNAVDNDRTLPLLGKTAVSLAQAGADIVAPSAMMDGQVKAIREALDAAGLTGTPVMSYAAKFSSAFYGPFREAAESSPSFGDRNAYQMAPGNRREAMREIQQDLNEGADFVMVKPALSYLDVIREARNRFDAPLAAYNVSGEYAMIKAAAEAGYIDEERIVREVLLSIHRAGADAIITYFAKQYAGKVLSW